MRPTQNPTIGTTYDILTALISCLDHTCNVSHYQNVNSLKMHSTKRSRASSTKCWARFGNQLILLYINLNKCTYSIIIDHLYKKKASSRMNSKWPPWCPSPPHFYIQVFWKMSIRRWSFANSVDCTIPGTQWKL